MAALENFEIKNKRFFGFKHFLVNFKRSNPNWSWTLPALKVIFWLGLEVPTTGRRRTNGYFTSAVEKLNQGLTQKNISSKWSERVLKLGKPDFNLIPSLFIHATIFRNIVYWELLGWTTSTGRECHNKTSFLPATLRLGQMALTWSVRVCWRNSDVESFCPLPLLTVLKHVESKLNRCWMSSKAFKICFNNHSTFLLLSPMFNVFEAVSPTPPPSLFQHCWVCACALIGLFITYPCPYP